jgi:dTMP kinase
MSVKDFKGAARVLEGFVVLEGLDGAGTTTQLNMLQQKLDKLRMPHFCTSEPTQGPVGTLIREVLQKRIVIHPQALALLFAADRTEHLQRGEAGILDRVSRGELVISDRYLFSSLAYQSVECDFDYVLSLNCSFPLPQVVFFLDTPPEVCQRRLKGRRQIDIFDDIATQERVRATYLRAISMFESSPMRVCLLDGSLEPAAVFQNIWSYMIDLSIIGT